MCFLGSQKEREKRRIQSGTVASSLAMCLYPIITMKIPLKPPELVLSQTKTEQHFRSRKGFQPAQKRITKFTQRNSLHSGGRPPLTSLTNNSSISQDLTSSKMEGPSIIPLWESEEPISDLEWLTLLSTPEHYYLLCIEIDSS